TQFLLRSRIKNHHDPRQCLLFSSPYLRKGFSSMVSRHFVDFMHYFTEFVPVFRSLNFVLLTLLLSRVCTQISALIRKYDLYVSSVLSSILQRYWLCESRVFGFLPFVFPY